MIRLLIFVMLAPPFAAALVGGIVSGNPIAGGMAVGLAGPVAFLGAAMLSKPKPAPRRADPAKIARLERELGIDLQERAEAAAGERGHTGDVRERWIAGYVAGDESEAPTEEMAWEPLPAERCETCGAGPGECFAEPLPCAREAPTVIVQPYAGPPHTKGWPEEHERHCPRPRGCIVAHQCRKCGADKGEACVGDPYTTQLRALSERIAETFAENQRAIDRVNVRITAVGRYGRKIR